MSAAYPYAARITVFSELLTLRGRSRFDTHANAESISPGVKAGSGTVQNPLDLSMSIFRQCCADARDASRNTIAHIGGRNIALLLQWRIAFNLRTVDYLSGNVGAGFKAT